jgi:hypothetical protein
MTNVDRPGAVPTAGYSVPDAAAARDSGDRRDLADLLDGEFLEFGEESSSAMAGRDTDSLRNFRAAIRDAKRDAEDEKEDTQQEQPHVQVLAVAQQPFWTGLPSPVDAVLGPAEGSVSSTEDTVASVAEAIDRAIRADMAPRARATLDLRLAFDNESLGLAGLRITITPTTLDVVFERTQTGYPEELVRAAERLAQRLMTRFSKKTVRILDITVPAQQADGEHADATVTPPLNLLR